MGNTKSNQQAERSVPVMAAGQADPDWMTKTEALLALNRSERGLDRLVTAAKIEKQMRQRAGVRPEPLFRRADIERLTAVEGFPVPSPAQSSELARTQPNQIAELLTTAIVQMQQIAILEASRASMPALPSPAAWVTLDSAAQLTGLSRRLLTRLVRSGSLGALRDGRAWKIRREDLEALRPPDRAPSATPVKLATMAGRGGVA